MMDSDSVNYIVNAMELGSDEALAKLHELINKPSRHNTPEPEFPKPMSILEEADHIINGERAVSYGDASESFQQIADYWTVYVNRAIKDGKVELSPLDVDNMMILMKVSRAQNGFHRDSYVDTCGYAALTPKLAPRGPIGPEKS